MTNRIVTVVIIVPLAIVLIALAVANRAPVALTADPFNPGNPALTWTMPLFVLVFLAIALGLIVGSMATWIRQGQYRKLARERGAQLRAVPTPSKTEHHPAPLPARPALSGPSA